MVRSLAESPIGGEAVLFADARRITLAAVVVGLFAAQAQAFPPNNNNAIQQLLQRGVQEQQRQQQAYQRALQQRNKQLIDQYKKQMEARKKAYDEQMKKLIESGITPDQLREMQREAILKQTPRSQQGALKRKWAREDRIRKMAAARESRAKGRTLKGDSESSSAGGGLGGLKLE